jgi:Type I phosphodiesterase / nucleotide pyrophosphatase
VSHVGVSHVGVSQADLAGRLLADVALPVPGLYRRHPEHNLGTVAAAIVAAYHDAGPVRLGRDRSLAVIAVDGLGYGPASSVLAPDVLIPLTSEFPTTTVACLLTSVTRRPSDQHGFIGVQYLHTDGLRTINCHDGSLTDPVGPAPARPTQTPRLPTVFDMLAEARVPTTLLANELAALDKDVTDRLTHGASVSATPPPHETGPLSLTEAFAAQVTASVRPGTVTWAYLDLDSHLHQHGFDQQARNAVAGLDRLARRLCRQGTAVLLFSDHGLTASCQSPDTVSAWREVARDRWCRLPPGGAGRTRWLYPHPRYEDRLTDMVAGRFMGAVVTHPDELAGWGLVSKGSVGQRRLGEIVMLAHAPDFPVPDAAVRFEHGSMTADEVLVPLALWSPL